MPKTSESRFRVRYAETDQMGVVYYANYFVWMEIGRSDFCKFSGFNYHEMEKREDAFIAVAEASCRYMASARYEDEVLVRTTIERSARRVISFSYEILNAETGVVFATGRTVHVVVGKDGKPKSIPAEYYQLLIRNEDAPKPAASPPAV